MPIFATHTIGASKLSRRYFLLPRWRGGIQIYFRPGHFHSRARHGWQWRCPCLLVVLIEWLFIACSVTFYCRVFMRLYCIFDQNSALVLTRPNSVDKILQPFNCQWPTGQRSYGSKVKGSMGHLSNPLPSLVSLSLTSELQFWSSIFKIRLWRITALSEVAGFH